MRSKGEPFEAIDDRGARDRAAPVPPSGSGEAPSGQRPRHDMIELPARWLDRLLLVALEMPVADGDLAVVRAIVDAIASLLPDHAVGACVVPIHGGETQVMRALPPGEEHRARGADPVRLFPGYVYETIVDLDGAIGSTLHVASDDAWCEDPGSSVGALVARAAVIARRGLDLARSERRATAAEAELRALHAQMVQAEKLASLGQIAAGAVHELNNPLTSIVAYTDFLIRKVTARGPQADPDEIDRLRRIAESAGRMLRFTRDLVSYARPSSEMAVAVGVHLVIDQALAFCEHVLHATGVEVDRRFGAQIPAVRGKPEQLAQVFVNLITNACHATPPGRGRLVLATEASAGTVRVSVKDNGAGIAPEHMPHVFAPFFTTKQSGVGTGLGLTIVKSIVDAHDGTIDVRSAQSGADAGTTFIVTLPAITAR